MEKNTLICTFDKAQYLCGEDVRIDLPPELIGGEAAENAFRLAWAAISASGGTQLVLGEDRCALRDSYYVNHARLRDEFCPVAQKYCDFLVRYADLLYDDRGTDISRTASGGINEDVCFSGGDCEFSTDGAGGTVWSICLLYTSPSPRDRG